MWQLATAASEPGKCESNNKTRKRARATYCALPHADIDVGAKPALVTAVGFNAVLVDVALRTGHRLRCGGSLSFWAQTPPDVLGCVKSGACGMRFAAAQ